MQTNRLNLAVLSCLFVGIATNALADDPSEDAHHPAPAPTPVGPGEIAPEWQLVGWSDGKRRELIDERGKIVVIDFWGVWCKPCTQLVPVIKKLQNKYSPRDVVFVSVHTAGVEMDQVKKALQREEWSIPTGLDDGDSITNGVTVRRFGVIGYPTLVIVGRDGRVVYNSSADMVPARREKALKEYKEIAEGLGLPWPIEEGASTPQLTERLQKLALALYERKIEAAIQGRAGQ
jgi:thiol-disulfide isomerase/thioredoxin